jgi:late competence protein required for DNA uptake (superfamily II DNA/RNA helicase)
MHIHEEAVEVLIGIDSETTVGNLDCFICQQNAHALSNLTKSIYRCKNSVFMGRRKAFLAKVFKGDD